ncbi:uncharacterized protein IUM83_19990 [Phytophthora cinnamomi]|uniref:uncharacterized protein n=1 Tax=Phytophthora cinnamomi TaxID=4785 RepID=UPI0035595180|nr:hypothetical protein IUM83_19990 [Phytophthora cinnamomi]
MAAVPPPPPLEVTRAAFFRLECSHAQLFQPEYKRSNRTKGLKILRCFPHCCPEHIDRSYCGTSLSVRVELATRASHGAPPSQVVAVFARFEATSDVSLRPGECVEVSKMAAATQSDSNLEGQWVAGTLDRPSKLVTTIRMPGAPPDDHKPLVFHLNGKPFSRWYYDWESGANKAQRLMKHVLKAYVVERCAVDHQDNLTDFTSRHAHTQLYRILDVVTSPEFTVISYRRAPSDQYQLPYVDGAALGYADAAEYAPELDNNSGRAYEHHPRSSIARSTEVRPPMEVSMDPFFTDAQHAKRQRTSPLAAYSPFSMESSDLLEDKLRWEHANASTVVVSRNLALAYSFLRWAPLSDYASYADELVQLIHGKLQEALAGPANEPSKLNCFSKLVLDQTEADQGSAGASFSAIGKVEADAAMKIVPPDLEKLARALAQAALWLFSAGTLKWMRAFFRQYARSVLDKHALRACFVLFVEELQDRLDEHVFEQTPLRCLVNVAEEVIAAVYTHEHFNARRPQVRGILSGQNFAGWNAFVAQMREAYINLSAQNSVPCALAQQNPQDMTFGEAHAPRNSIENDWNDTWVMDVEEAVWKPSEQVVAVGIGNSSGSRSVRDDTGSVSLFSVVQVISQLVRLEVALDVEARMLLLRSTEGVTGALDCMRIVLDGKERVFSQFPNGMASGVSAGGNGDYIAEMRVDQPGRLVVYLQIFTWSQDGPSYRARMRLECWRSQRLCISGDVLVTTAPASFTTEDALYLGEMSLRSKREAVQKGFSQQLREKYAATGATSPSSVASWQELGRFRFSYVKG